MLLRLQKRRGSGRQLHRPYPSSISRPRGASTFAPRRLKTECPPLRRSTGPQVWLRTKRPRRSAAALQRPKFKVLIEHKLEKGDTLIVTKIDRLGRNLLDVKQTIDALMSRGVKIHVLQMGGMDITSPAGALMLNMLAMFAEFERGLLIERTKSGLERAKAQGKTLGRRPSLTEEQQNEVMDRLTRGESINGIARLFKTTAQTILRVRERRAAAITNANE
ncbi:recombinase family protein [Paraburkholderia unamae]|nr:recombinase family protein [Paraburkholderia unamae]